MHPLFVYLLVLILASPVQIHAEEKNLRKPDPEKIQERLEFFTMWKMMEALDLDKQTADKIMEIRKKFLSGRKEIQKSLANDFQILKDILKTPRGQEDPNKLKPIIADVRQKRTKLEALQDEYNKEVSSLLTVRQQAELILFLKDFQKELQQMIRPRPGPGAPAPPGMGPPQGDRSRRQPPGPPGMWRDFDDVY
jgi:Spy/CpxP family protein refolding chaperone